MRCDAVLCCAVVRCGAVLWCGAVVRCCAVLWCGAVWDPFRFGRYPSGTPSLFCEHRGSEATPITLSNEITSAAHGTFYSRGIDEHAVCEAAFVLYHDKYFSRPINSQKVLQCEFRNCEKLIQHPTPLPEPSYWMIPFVVVPVFLLFVAGLVLACYCTRLQCRQRCWNDTRSHEPRHIQVTCDDICYTVPASEVAPAVASCLSPSRFRPSRRSSSPLSPSAPVPLSVQASRGWGPVLLLFSATQRIPGRENLVPIVDTTAEFGTNSQIALAHTSIDHGPTVGFSGVLRCEMSPEVCCGGCARPGAGQLGMCEIRSGKLLCVPFSPV